MGRRPTRTTKHGKFMNPTDQFRKNCRRKELLRNKKQRETVRMAVLKSKQPQKIIEELESLDKIQFNPVKTADLSEKVIDEKRERLLETFERVKLMWGKEEPESAIEMKRMMDDYLKWRTQLQQYYTQVRQAESVELESVPMPTNQGPSEIPLPGDLIPPPPSSRPHSILKRAHGPLLPSEAQAHLQLPPPPSSPPPELSDSDSEDGDAVDAYDPEEAASELQAATQAQQLQKKHIRFADDGSDDSDSDRDSEPETSAPPQAARMTAPPVHLIPPPQMRMPPPRMMQTPSSLFPPTAVLSAPPSIIHRRGDVKLLAPKPVAAATIEKKAQLKNLLAESTKFVPTTLKVRREWKDTRGVIHQTSALPLPELEPEPATAASSAAAKPKQQMEPDDAYSSFMKEMSGLM